MCAVAINTEVNTENNLQLESFTPFFFKSIRQIRLSLNYAYDFGKLSLNICLLYAYSIA